MRLSAVPFICLITILFGATPFVQAQTAIDGELMQWHKVTLTFDGPATSETATPNPFLDYRLDVTFTHSDSGNSYLVPGYYAADGDAANTGASSGNKWRVHFAPDATGEWSYTASFVTGSNVAVNPAAAATPTSFDGASGSFTIAPSDKTGRDFRAHGRLEYVGEHYLRFAGSGEYFLKQGPDAPENFLAYAEFDGPFKSDGQKDNLVKDWLPHAGDWQAGDPTWGQVDGASGTFGQEIIGAVNYLASEGMNAFSFLTMNINGDDRNVFPYTAYNQRTRMDVSRLDQWGIVFDHATSLGMFLHFKTQETENDQLLDGGNLGTQRTLYYRELIARFSHNLALNWNLGEENDIWNQLNDPNQTRVKAYAQYFYDTDPYRHSVVIHSYPGQKNQVYTPLLGNASKLTGASLQTNRTDFANVHRDVKTWVENSAASGKKWVVAADEPGDAQFAIRPDDDAANSHEDGRKNALWGTFMAGGWGNEWYFGYSPANSDLTLNDFRSRDAWWDYCRHALAFWDGLAIPVENMLNANALVGSSGDYVFAQEGELYVVYLKNGGSTTLDLSAAEGEFSVSWYDPRNGGPLQSGSVTLVNGGEVVALGTPPSAPSGDWALLVERVPTSPRVAYLHGDVSPNGFVPSSSDPAPADQYPYDQMLLDDTGNKGLSILRNALIDAGYEVSQHYDQGTVLSDAFLANYDVIIFGLHQKIWSAAEKDALDRWLNAGGGMLTYSDSAAGGWFSRVGIKNTVGQSVVNNLITDYGMQVTVDLGAGTRSYQPDPAIEHPVTAPLNGQPIVLEGEGVSPVAVDETTGARVLFPFEDAFKVGGSATPSIDTRNITIPVTRWAALASQTVGQGQVMVLFDRQPLWNDGPGSDIEKADNLALLLRIVDDLSEPDAAPPVNLAPTVNAGADAAATLSDATVTVTLSGSVSDDGLPSGTLASTWSVVSGPAAVSFDDASSAATAATFSALGSYTLELSATDGALSNSDTMMVTIGDGTTPLEGVISFSLIDADSDLPIAGFDPIAEGAEINLATLPAQNLNIEANTNPIDVTRVVFFLNGANVATERVAPYAIGGDSSGDFRPYALSPGSYTLEGVPGIGDPLTLNFTVVDGAPIDLFPSIQTDTLPAAGELDAYSATLVATSGDAPLTWSLASGALPAGLNLSADGIISGTPQSGAAGDFDFTVAVTDADGDADTQALTLTVTAQDLSPVIATIVLDAAQENTSYSSALTAVSGNLPYAWSVTGGSLPTGLSLSANGIVSGTPLSGTSGTYNPTFTVADVDGDTDSQTIELTVLEQDLSPVIATTVLEPAEEGSAYVSALTAVSGNLPYTWSVLGGSLPAGLALSTDGVITGTPDADTAGSYDITFQVSDVDGDTDSTELTLLVEAAPNEQSMERLVFIDAGSAANDAGFSGGRTFSTSRTIDTATLTDPLPESAYQSERWATNLTYSIEGLDANTEYLLRLHFAEIWRGSGVGVRVFDVSVNGTLVLDDFDIFATTGGFEIAYVEELWVSTDDLGAIEIAMSASANNAKISAIEVYTPVEEDDDDPVVIPVEFFGVNAGGAAVDLWSADQGFDGGRKFATSRAMDLSSAPFPAPEAVYQSERWTPNDLTYTFDQLAPDGYYVVRLHFAEIYQTVAGTRQFNVAINGDQVLFDLDIFAEVGRDTALVKEYSVLATSAGEIEVFLSKGAIENAKISGIEILSVNGGEPNEIPQIFGDSFDITGNNGEAVIFDVLANDVDSDGPSPLFLVSLGDREGSLNGTVEIVDNKVQYTPPGPSFGFDVFDYTVSDGLHTVEEIVVFIYNFE